MSRDSSEPRAQLQGLLEQARSLRPVPQVIRARLLKRARASAALGANLPPSAAPPASVSVPISWWGGAALTVALAVGVAATLRHHESHESAGERPRPTASVAAVSERPESPTARPELQAELTSPSAGRSADARPSRRLPEAESYGAELELLRRAGAAYANGDFATALRLLAEHGRKFPNGRLAEEREALRVRALSSSGRMGAARAAGQAFATRFPRSVLLSRTNAAVDAGAAQ